MTATKKKKTKRHAAAWVSFNLGSRLFNSTFGKKKLIEEGIKYTLDIYNSGVKNIQNKKLKRALESDLGTYVVKKAQGRIYNWQNL